MSPEYINMYEARLKAVREAIGPNVDIIIENHSFTDAQSATQIGKMAKNIESFTSKNLLRLLRNYASLFTMKQACRLRMENGFIRDGSILSTLKRRNPSHPTRCRHMWWYYRNQKICDMAYVFDVGVQVHACGSPISTAAALQLECAIPNFVIHEHHTYALSPYNKELCIYDYQPENGKFAIPDLPGIGQELSKTAYENCDLITIQ